MPPRRSSRRRSRQQLSGPGALLLLILIAAVFFYRTYIEEDINFSPAVTRPPAAEQQAAGESITVWFSDPLSGRESGGPENNLIGAINSAAQTVDVAIYNISLESIGDALYNAHRRGVQVRMVMESEAMDRKVPQSLARAGIPIVGDQREGLMHNKFVIIDGQEVWMGSMNFTSTSAYKDFNNLLRFRSTQMVRNYQVNFNEMFEEQKFGNDKEANTPSPLLNVAGIPVEVYFSPDDGVADQIVEEIRQARQSIDFLAYSFTSDDIASAMLARAKTGVTLRGVFDESQVKSNQGGEYEYLKDARFPVYMDGISGLLHDKVIIIDGQTVITGSYNFSASAESNNDENLVIIHDAKIAEQYLQHFEQVYSNAQR